MRSANTASINARAPGLRLADARRRPSPPPAVDAATLAGNVLDRIGTELRRAQLVAAKHALSGCPTPDCRACEGERRRLAAQELREYRERDAVARKEAAKQHAISSRRLAELAARRRPRRELANMERWAPACASCRSTPQGVACQSCGTTSFGRLDVLDVINLRRPR